MPSCWIEVEVGATFAKVTFWSGGRPAFVQKEIGAYVQRHGLKPGDHVWLRVIEPGAKFAVERSPG